MKIDKLALLTGVNIPIPTMQMELKQPTIKEIAKIGEEEFFSALGYCLVTKEDFLKAAEDRTEEEKAQLRAELEFLTDLDVVLASISGSPETIQNLKNFLLLLFPGLKKISISEGFVTGVRMDGTDFLINSEMFKEISSAVSKLFSMPESNSSKLNPVGDKAKAIAAKIEARRKKLAQKNAGGEIGGSALASAMSVLSTASGISVREIAEYTIPQLFTQVDRANKFIAYQDQISLGAFGGLKDVELVDWKEVL